MALSDDGEGGGIHTVELYRKVRLACREGMSERAAARHFGISRESVRKMLRFSVPPGYRRTAQVRRPKLDGFTELIDQWLEEDRRRPRKQRHTAKRVFDRLRAEYGFRGSYTIVKDYMREHRRRRRELFVPLVHPPGHAQADRNLSTTLRHRRLRFTEQSVLLWIWQWVDPDRVGKRQGVSDAANEAFRMMTPGGAQGLFTLLQPRSGHGRDGRHRV